MNARSIVNKVSQLCVLIEDTKPSIILITETWLSNSVSDAELNLKDYCIFRQDRSHGQDPHGGVLIAIKVSLNSRRVNIDTSLEVCFADIFINNVTLRLCVSYRPPLSSYEHSKTLIELIRNKLDNVDYFIILGDFNFSGIDWDLLVPSNSSERFFLDILNEMCSTQIINEPTTEYSSILDLCVVSDDTLVTNVCVGDLFSTSDHCYITGEINLPVQKNDEPRLFFNFELADWDLMRAHLAITDWDQIFQGTSNIEEAWFGFKNIINTFTYLYVPQQIFTKIESLGIIKI